MSASKCCFVLFFFAASFELRKRDGVEGDYNNFSAFSWCTDDLFSLIYDLGASYVCLQ